VRLRSARVHVACAAAAFSLLASIGGASASTKDSVGTPAQVTKAVRSSISINTISPAVAKSLKVFSSPSGFKLTGPSSFSYCDPYNSEALALAPRPCLAGNVLATKTIVLVGDSNVGNWVPALNLGLESTQYRLAVFGFSSCGLANLPYTSSWGSLFERCRQWHANVPVAIRKLHPVAVLVASGDVGIRQYSDAVWASGVKSLFDEATRGSPSAKRIVMGTSPFFGESAVTCLTVHPDPQTCSLRYTQGSYYGAGLSRDKLVASASDAKLIDTSKYFCYSNTCPPIIGNILVYSDIDHVTIAYSSFISRVITSAVLADLK
jgi:SGNH domain (fused to AT3 domains)